MQQTAGQESCTIRGVHEGRWWYFPYRTWYIWASREGNNCLRHLKRAEIIWIRGLENSGSVNTDSNSNVRWRNNLLRRSKGLLLYGPFTVTGTWHYRIKYRVLYSISLYFSVINSDSWDVLPPEVFSNAKSIFFCSYFIVTVIGSE